MRGSPTVKRLKVRLRWLEKLRNLDAESLWFLRQERYVYDDLRKKVRLEVERTWEWFNSARAEGERHTSLDAIVIGFPAIQAIADRFERIQTLLSVPLNARPGDKISIGDRRAFEAARREQALQKSKEKTWEKN